MFFVFSNDQKRLDKIYLWQICSLCKSYLAYEYFSGPICTYMIPNITALQHTPSSSIHMEAIYSEWEISGRLKKVNWFSNRRWYLIHWYKLIFGTKNLFRSLFHRPERNIWLSFIASRGAYQRQLPLKKNV